MLTLDKGLKEGNLCPNCDTRQEVDTKFCPKCGQKHLDIRRSVKEFLIEFLDNNFSFDSKVFRTTIYLLFKPGYLSRDYIEGKRIRFLPPMRLYLFFSVFFFAGLLTTVSQKDLEEANHLENKIRASLHIDTLQQELNRNIAATQKTYPASKDALDSLNKLMSFTFSKDSIFLNKMKTGVFNVVSWGEDNKISVSLIDAYTLSADEIIKKYKINGFINQFLTEQVLKMSKNLSGFINDFLSSKLWWATFLMIPITALLLKLLYWRRKRFYSEHLIFSFHYFSFTLLLGIPLFQLNNQWQGVYFLFYTIISLVYMLKAMKVFYEQGWVKTILKGVLLQFITIFLFILCMIFAAVVGVILF